MVANQGTLVGKDIENGLVIRNEYITRVLIFCAKKGGYQYASV